MKKYKWVNLYHTPSSPCKGCDLEEEEKIIRNYAPNKKNTDELIERCANCKKLLLYQEYTYLLHLRIPVVGSSFDAMLCVTEKELEAMIR